MADVDAVLRALSAPARREILGLIWDRDLPAGEIAAAFDLTAATISEHLAVLREAGLVDMTKVGTSRRYRARQAALDGLHGALEGATKWVPADDVVESPRIETSSHRIVVAAVDVGVDQQTAFTAFTDDVIYSRWLGAPVTIKDGRFAATMEFGTEIRGRYELVVPPELIVMSWDFEDENVPVPGRPLTGYLRVLPGSKKKGSRIEVHQLVDTPQQVELMESAWGMVLSRFERGVVAASNPQAELAKRPPRPKTKR